MMKSQSSRCLWYKQIDCNCLVLSLCRYLCCSRCSITYGNMWCSSSYFLSCCIMYCCCILTSSSEIILNHKLQLSINFNWVQFFLAILFLCYITSLCFPSFVVSSLCRSRFMLAFDITLSFCAFEPVLRISSFLTFSLLFI